MFCALTLVAGAEFLCKISILLFYWRIFFISNGYRKVSLGLMIFTTAWCLAVILVVVCMCRPILIFWDDSGPVYTCVNWKPFLYTMLIVDMITDVCILVLPVRTVLGLHLPRKTRIAVAGIFTLGGFVVTTNVLRIGFASNQGSRYESRLLVQWPGCILLNTYSVLQQIRALDEHSPVSHLLASPTKDSSTDFARHNLEPPPSSVQACRSTNRSGTPH